MQHSKQACCKPQLDFMSLLYLSGFSSFNRPTFAVWTNILCITYMRIFAYAINGTWILVKSHGVVGLRVNW